MAIRVLVVDDSQVVLDYLTYLLSLDAEIQVIGTARDGEEAIKFVQQEKPDVITMDIYMPRMNGFEATRRIMERHPVPIVLVSANWSPEEVAMTFRAMEVGAVAVVEKPRGIGHKDQEATARQLIQTVKLMSEVKVVRRWTRSSGKLGTFPRREETISTIPSSPELQRTLASVSVVAIGASTGGPPVLQTILSGLSRDFPTPILVVQHIAVGFIQGFVNWLNQSSELPIHVATQGAPILPGHVYVAPDEFQMKVEPGRTLSLSKDEPEYGLRPAVSCLFRSVAKIYGESGMGILLTGMGKDGAEELKLMREKGAVTVVQDKESSVVHGMPGEAIKLGAATYVLPPDQIVAMLRGLGAKKGRV